LRSAPAALLLTGILAAPASARRLPAYGGEIAVHTSVPIGVGRLLDPTVAVAEPSGTGVVVRGSHPRVDVAASLRACAEARAGWLDRLGVRLTIVGEATVASVDAVPGVGALPLLLSTCDAVGREGGTLGAFARGGSASDDSRGDLGARPFLDRIVRTAERADADVAPADEGAFGLPFPLPDVYLLVPNEAARAQDALRWSTEGGRRQFALGLRADLLVAATFGGRGGPGASLLPPGAGPVRPVEWAGETAPTLDLPADTPLGEVQLAAAGDRWTRELTDRVALLLRAAGARAVFRPAEAGPTVEGGSMLTVFRVAPASGDPGLAMLHTLAVAGLDVPTADARSLLAPTLADRVAAARTIEGRLVDAGAVMPLAWVQRSLAVNPRLRGIELREDGSIGLDGAWLEPP
jgi:hypothetical protein